MEDLLSLHDGDAGAPIIFGCETRETGEIYKQRADGLFGLGNSDVSVINQVCSVPGHIVHWACGAPMRYLLSPAGGGLATRERRVVI